MSTVRPFETPSKEDVLKCLETIKGGKFSWRALSEIGFSEDVILFVKWMAVVDFNVSPFYPQRDVWIKERFLKSDFDSMYDEEKDWITSMIRTGNTDHN